MTERELQRQIVKTLRATGWSVHILSRVGTARGNRGLPDLFIRHLARKRHAWIEVKLPTGKLRPEQQTFRDAALVAGEEHYVVRALSYLTAL